MIWNFTLGNNSICIGEKFEGIFSLNPFNIDDRQNTSAYNFISLSFDSRKLDFQ